MKKAFIFILLMSAGLFAEAQSMLRVSLSDNSPINVSVDGRYFNKRGTSITVGDLPPGRHYVKIFIVAQTNSGRGYEDAIYEGRVKTRPGAVTLIAYNPETREVQTDMQDMDAYMSNRGPSGPPRPFDDGRGYPGRSDNGYQNNQNNNGYGNNGYGNNGYNDNGNRDNNGYNNYNNNNYNSNNNNGGYNNDGNAASASPVPVGSLQDTKVDNLKLTVSAKNTDTEKMRALKDALQGETYTAAQVGTMMDWFGFEATKVEFAEWAFPNTVDKEYFSDLEGRLTYKSYRDDLDKFIKSKQ